MEESQHAELRYAPCNPSCFLISDTVLQMVVEYVDTGLCWSSKHSWNVLPSLKKDLKMRRTADLLATTAFGRRHTQRNLSRGNNPEYGEAQTEAQMISARRPFRPVIASVLVTTSTSYAAQAPERK